jgi:hypothetical protein
MDVLEQLVNEVALPMDLPEGAVLQMGKRLIPNFEIIFNLLPSDLLNRIDPEGTAPGGGPEGYYIPIRDGRYLKILLTSNQLVGLKIIGD